MKRQSDEEGAPFEKTALEKLESLNRAGCLREIEDAASRVPTPTAVVSSDKLMERACPNESEFPFSPLPHHRILMTVR
jgi:hypothetical protein